MPKIRRACPWSDVSILAGAFPKATIEKAVILIIKLHTFQIEIFAEKLIYILNTFRK